MHEVWERFKDLLHRCPHHGISKVDLLRTFYIALGNQLKTMIDASAGGSLMNKSAAEAEELIEQIAKNTFNWHNERNRAKPVHALYELDEVSQLKAQMASLTAQFNRMQPTSSAGSSHTQMMENASFGNPSMGYSSF